VEQEAGSREDLGMARRLSGRCRASVECQRPRAAPTDRLPVFRLPVNSQSSRAPKVGPTSGRSPIRTQGAHPPSYRFRPRRHRRPRRCRSRPPPRCCLRSLRFHSRYSRCLHSSRSRCCRCLRSLRFHSQRRLHWWRPCSNQHHPRWARSWAAWQRCPCWRCTQAPPLRTRQ